MTKLPAIHRLIRLSARVVRHVLHIVLDKVENGEMASDKEGKRLAREEAGRRIRELRKGHLLGPDLTVRDLMEEGRRF